MKFIEWINCLKKFCKKKKKKKKKKKNQNPFRLFFAEFLLIKYSVNGILKAQPFEKVNFFFELTWKNQQLLYISIKIHTLFYFI